MRQLRKFLQLTWTERRILFQAWLLLWIVRLGLWIAPFARMRALVERWSQPPKHRARPSNITADRIAWLIEVASRYVLRGRHCLTRALAAEILLSRRLLPVKLHFGAFKDEQDKIQAHAWVESNGTVVIGGEELDRYTILKETQGSEP